MSEEEKKKEEKEVKGCGDCLIGHGNTLSFQKMEGGRLFGAVFAFCLIAAIGAMCFSLDGGGARTVCLGLATFGLLMFGTFYSSWNVVGRYLYGFHAKEGKWHLHAKSVPYVVTKMYASGPTKDYCDRAYYYIPSNMAGSQEELFSKFGIDRPILRIPDGGWFKSYAILSSGTTRYNDWSIDHAQLTWGTLTVRLRYKKRDDTAMIVTPEEAIRIIETCNDQVGTKSLASYLLDEMEHRKVMLGYAMDDLHGWAKNLEVWKKHAVGGWSRVRLLDKLLFRLQIAIAETKGKIGSKVAAGNARLAIEYLRSNGLVFPLPQDRDFMTSEEVTAAYEAVARKFDAMLPPEHVMLKDPAVAAETSPAPTVQQA